MRCDIHLAIEYTAFTTQAGDPYWAGFGGGKFNPGRDYAMFGCLAGVRDGAQPHIPTRGYPTNLSYASQAAFFRVDPETGDVTDDSDLHSATWLTREEYGAAYAQRMFDSQYPPDPVYEVVLITMNALEERGLKTRLVFAFDN